MLVTELTNVTTFLITKQKFHREKKSIYLSKMNELNWFLIYDVLKAWAQRRFCSEVFGLVQQNAKAIFLDYFC